MALIPFTSFAVDASGDILASTAAAVRDTDGNLATLYNQDGTSLTNPTTSGTDGKVTFWAEEGFYEVTTGAGGSAEAAIVHLGAGRFKTVAALAADTGMAYSPTGRQRPVVSGDVVEAEGFRYQVLASGASGADVTTAGGVKLQVLPHADGRYPLAAFGSDGTALQAAVTRAAGSEIVTKRGTTINFSTAITLPSGGVHFSGRGTLNYTGSNAAFTASAAITAFRARQVTLSCDASQRIFDLAYDVDFIEFHDTVLTGWDKCVDTTTQAITVDRVRLTDNYVHTCGTGFIIQSDEIGTGRATGNYFLDITRAGTIFCIQLGGNDVDGVESRGDFVVSGNTFKNIVSSVSNAETHAAICFGKRVVMTDNTVLDLYNAGNEDSEALYTKARFFTISNNVVEDGGYCGQGAIAVKGLNRGETQTTPYGYGGTVIGNTIRNDGTTADQTGIYIQAENVTCIGNYTEGCTKYDIAIAARDGHAVNVSNNVSVASAAAFPILSFLDANDVIISKNTISEWLGEASALSAAIQIETGTVGPKQVSVEGNVVSLASGSIASSVYGVRLNTENDGSTFERISIVGNIIDVAAVGSSVGIDIGGSETVENLIVALNQVKTNSNNHLAIAGTVTITGTVKIRDNVLRGNFKRTSAQTLTYDRMGQANIYTGSGDASWTLPAAVVGATFTLINRNTAADAVGFDAAGSDVFYDGTNTVATIAVPGALTVECFEAGIWEVTSASGAVTYAA